MSDLTDFAELTKIVEELNDLRAGLSEYRELGNIGSYSKLDDLIMTTRGIFHLLPDHTLKRVIVYQAERHFRMSEKQDDTIDPTFHIYKCDVLKKQLSERTKRFKITTRKDGMFLVKDYKFDELMQRVEEKHYKKLLVCNFCYIMYNRIKRSDIVREDFSIKEYFDTGYTTLTFTYNHDEIPVGYQSVWQEIASALKEKHTYTCEKCGLKIEKLFAEKFINTHFLSEILCKRQIDKVKVLCLGCHAEEPKHGHIKQKPEYQHFIDHVARLKGHQG